MRRFGKSRKRWIEIEGNRDVGAVDRVVKPPISQAQRASRAARIDERHRAVDPADITGQINLARRSTRPSRSARAGEARPQLRRCCRRGQNLANQAKQATDKIATRRSSNLNGISGDVVRRPRSSIKNAIQGVSEYVTSTAAAIEEQSTVTGEMSRA